MLGTCYICAIDTCLAPLNKVPYGSLVNSSLNFFLIYLREMAWKILREWRLITAWCTFSYKGYGKRVIKNIQSREVIK